MQIFKTIMNYSHIKNFAVMTLAAGLLATSVTAAKATITCSGWKAGDASGDQIYNCNFSTGNTGGSYDNSYWCYNKIYHGYCLVDYKGGNAYQGDCSVVFKCSDGKSYVCDIRGWDGKETIKCNYIPRNCDEIEIRCPQTSSVPEPATVLSASLLLIPLGFSAVRILRKNKTQLPG